MPESLALISALDRACRLWVSARSGSTRLWRAYPRETLGFGILALTGAAALAGSAWSSPTLDGLPRGSATSVSTPIPPAPPPLLVRDIKPEDAAAINAAIPIDGGANPAARPFALRGADSASQARALECLTSAVYYEAGNESGDGLRAVAQVVLNRVRHPAFPASVCEVVYQGSTRSTGCQFTFTCDGSLARRPGAAGWARSRAVAEAALAGFVHKPVGWATHYHANYVVPYWASSLVKNAVIGTHIFYRWTGGWGRPPAFTQRYSGREPDADALRAAAALAEQQKLEVTAAEAAAAIPGAELVAASKGETRPGIRFNLASARKAVEAAPQVAYVEKHSVSDNLRWTLSGGVVAEQEKPLGRPAPVIGERGGGGPSGAKEALEN